LAEAKYDEIEYRPEADVSEIKALLNEALLQCPEHPRAKALQQLIMARTLPSEQISGTSEVERSSVETDDTTVL
jgi:hypothetical protein